MWCLIKLGDFVILLSMPEGRILCSKLRKFYVYLTLYRPNGPLTFACSWKTVKTLFCACAFKNEK